MDLGYSLNIVTKVRAFAKEHEILVRYEMLRQQIRDTAEERKEKAHWFLRFQSRTSLLEHLSKYLELDETLKMTPEDVFDKYANGNISAK